MSDQRPVTVLAISSYFKGEAFLEELKRQGCRVLLLTEEKVSGEPWPRASIDEVFLMPDLTRQQDVTYAVSYLCRSQVIDQIIALDEFDVETAAALREHLRLPGMGITATRNFRDKLVMREKTHQAGILVPDFTQVLNYEKLHEFMDRVPAPWVLKPRAEASSMGIKKVHHQDELWRLLYQLGDRQSYFLLERYVPGDVFHVDSVVWDDNVAFANVSKYGRPPMNIYHEGGVFVTRNVANNSEDAKALKKLNAQVIKALGLARGAAHAEFIQGHDDGQFYFLEIAARVGGANISDLIEQATGVNPWREWAKIVAAEVRGEIYEPPKPRQEYGGLIVCLARQEQPDLSGYNDAEIAWRMHKKQHAGLIVVSPDQQRVQQLVDSYTERFAKDFLAVAPPKESAADMHQSH
jgi:ATP-grasp domain-containing protein